MAVVARLVTLVELRDAPDAGQTSVSVRQEAVLDDGRHVLLLGDRGWTSRLVGGGDMWSLTSPAEIESTARAVVGPDEPFDGRSQEDMETDHWAYLARVLREQGVVVDAEELRRRPHDVVLGQRLLARIGRGRADAR